MTTVIDPAGTPVPVFNRSGKAIVDVAPAYGGASVAIPNACGHVIARVTPTGSPGSGVPQVDLPSSASIGDVVEVHPIAQTTVWVNAPSGELFLNGNALEFAPQSQGRAFRKIDVSLWSFAG